MTVPTSTRHVHAFDAADGAEIDQLGGKGAGLARMTSLGLPVPPGFTVDTGVCQAVLRACLGQWLPAVPARRHASR